MKYKRRRRPDHWGEQPRASHTALEWAGKGVGARHYQRCHGVSLRTWRLVVWVGVPVVTGRQIGLQASGGAGSAKHAGGAGVMKGWYSAPHSRCALKAALPGRRVRCCEKGAARCPMCLLLQLCSVRRSTSTGTAPWCGIRMSSRTPGRPLELSDTGPLPAARRGVGARPSGFPRLCLPKRRACRGAMAARASTGSSDSRPLAAHGCLQASSARGADGVSRLW